MLSVSRFTVSPPPISTFFGGFWFVCVFVWLCWGFVALFVVCFHDFEINTVVLRS